MNRINEKIMLQKQIRKFVELWKDKENFTIQVKFESNIWKRQVDQVTNVEWEISLNNDFTNSVETDSGKLKSENTLAKQGNFTNKIIKM